MGRSVGKKRLTICSSPGFASHSHLQFGRDGHIPTGRPSSAASAIIITALRSTPDQFAKLGKSELEDSTVLTLLLNLGQIVPVLFIRFKDMA